MKRRNTIEGFTPHLAEIEAQIINRIITSALENGGSVSVCDGEEWPLIKSKSRKAIQDEVAASCETTFRFYNKNGDRTGWVWLIHGNIADVISDYAANEPTNALLQAAMHYADTVG